VVCNAVFTSCTHHLPEWFYSVGHCSSRCTSSSGVRFSLSLTHSLSLSDQFSRL